jgi:DNA-binding MarR family transcriptional regulator
MTDQERNLLQQIARTTRAMHAAFEVEVGQPLPRWRILMTLSEGGEASQRDLARMLSMDPASLTRQMKSLEAEGLVARHSDPQDNRLTKVVLTPAGQALFEQTQPLRFAFAKKALKGLPLDQLDATMNTLQMLEARFRR